jgi:hypothetical protein
MKRSFFLKLITFLPFFSCSKWDKDENDIDVNEMILIRTYKPAYIYLQLRKNSLFCDFHTHTIYSDSYYSPEYRVDEAINDGLDVLAITDHLDPGYHLFPPIEYNMGYNRAYNHSRDKNILIIHGGEITRDMPPGHFNALFIKDESKLATGEIFSVFKEAISQGAFIQWNHPGWKEQIPDGIAKLYEIHKEMIRTGRLHGIEVCNAGDYYPEALAFCLNNNITVMCNSDIHVTTNELYPNKRRPITIVFAKDRSINSVKEAISDGYTIAFHNNVLIGKENIAKLFISECLSFIIQEKNPLIILNIHMRISQICILIYHV